MKKILATLMSIILFVVIALFVTSISPTLACADSSFYVVALSTTAGIATQGATGSLTPNIALAKVNVKSMTVSNPAALAQTITVYDMCTSTTARVRVLTYDIPATIGVYTLVPPVSTLMGSGDCKNWPYLGVCSSTSSTTCTLNVEYAK